MSELRIIFGLMPRLRNSRSARISWLIGVLVALSLIVVVPIHLNHRFFPACKATNAGLRAAHHTVVDQPESRVEARIERAGRAATPDSVATAMLSASLARSTLPRLTTAPPRVQILRHLRIAPGYADDRDPLSHARSLRV
jgi:hypothetical protein